MRIHLIANPAVEATAGDSTGPIGGRARGFARASDAYLAAGIVADVTVAGAEVTGTSRPELAAAEVSGDRVLDLGRYGALIAAAVSGAVGAGEAPLLAGGTCNHLVGMLAGLQQGFGADARIGLVWFDAHGDFNTPRTSHSGMLGGMPVAVAAGLCHPTWREVAGMTAPLPTDRIVMVDVRNLDPEEAALVAATDVTISQLRPDAPGPRVAEAVAALAAKVDHLYLHIDADVLDRSLQPNHPTAEPDGPDLAATVAGIQAVFATGKVRALAVVSVDPTGPDGPISLASGLALLRESVTAWTA